MKDDRIHKTIVYFVPFYSRTEKKLQDMEATGYKVKSIHRGYLFEFERKKEPDAASYFIIKYMMKDFDSDLEDVRCDLCSRYKAYPVKSIRSDACVLRIPESVENTRMRVYEATRNRYFARVLKWELFGSIVLLAACSALVLLPNATVASICLGVIGGLFSLFFIIKAIFGFFFLSKKDNKQY